MKLFEIPLILILLNTFASLLHGQNQGVIIYEVKVNLHRTLPKERQDMKEMIPEYQSSAHELYFNENASLYKAVEDDEDTFEAENGGAHIKLRMPQTEIYIDAGNMRRTLQEEFMGKEYLIKDTLRISPWKFGVEERSLLGHACKRAFYKDELRKQTIVAWYTSDLKPFLGPESFCTLPGTVLAVDINDGERVITAKSINMRPLKKNELKAPQNGIPTTQTEFRKMVDAQSERMRANGANMIFRN